ncbi:hypothetical protein SAMN04488498_103102 [Mesorhizobium albiziae]|uniref:Uncharacterized protein n=1 Tax=Neomesorhizobium albiziae TaxID=335020 RepID=A0A1I3XC89_9HYPH|nr:hypothetical protein SAMN04488498_103102 [Mesorhizobium albiziae]
MNRSPWIWRLVRFADPFSFYTFALTISWKPDFCALLMGASKCSGFNDLSPGSGHNAEPENSFHRYGTFYCPWRFGV